MINHITIKERGATPGILKRELNAITKASWFDAAGKHHAENTQKRFTEAHAREAGYTKRKGEGLDRSSKKFRKSYYGRKLLSDKGGGRGQALPLVFTGRSRDRSKLAKIVTTRDTARIRFNTPAFNFRHQKSQVNMADEFRRILPREHQEIAKTLDGGIDKRMNSLQSTKLTTVR